MAVSRSSRLLLSGRAIRTVPYLFQVHQLFSTTRAGSYTMNRLTSQPRWRLCQPCAFAALALLFLPTHFRKSPSHRTIRHGVDHIWFFPCWSTYHHPPVSVVATELVIDGRQPFQSSSHDDDSVSRPGIDTSRKVSLVSRQKRLKFDLSNARSFAINRTDGGKTILSLTLFQSGVP